MKNYLIYKVLQGDSKQTIAKQFGVMPSAIICEYESLNPGDRVVVDLNPKIVHIVLPAETFESIATKYNTTASDIKQKNGNISSLFVGQQLFI